MQAIEPTAEPTEEPTPEPTEPEDPYAIPDVIDVEYVQSVIDAVLPISVEPELEAYRTAPHQIPPPELHEAVRASYSPDQTVNIMVGYIDELFDEERAAQAAASAEAAPEPRWSVTGLEVAEPTCIVFTFEYPEGGPEEGGRAALLTGYDARDTAELNPTPWVIDTNGPADVYPPEDVAARCTAEQLPEEPTEANDA